MILILELLLGRSSQLGFLGLEEADAALVIKLADLVTSHGSAKAPFSSSFHPLGIPK